jgi:hypothetical protein
MLERTSKFLQTQAEIHETDLLHAPTNVPLPQHFPSNGPNKQYLMDEMPIQCPWESDHVELLNVCSKILDCICSIPSQNP